MASSPITSWQGNGETMETVIDLIFLASTITADGDWSHEIKRRLLLRRKAMTNPDSILKSRDITNKGPSSQNYSFSSSHVWMRELDHKEVWVLKNWCFGTVVLENTLGSPLGCKEIQPVNCKRNQPWIIFGKTDAKAETPNLWLPNAKRWLIWKDPDAGKDWRQEEKGMTEDEMVVWQHWLSGHEFEQAPGFGDDQEACAVHGVAKSDTTEWLNWTEQYRKCRILSP